MLTSSKEYVTMKRSKHEQKLNVQNFLILQKQHFIDKNTKMAFDFLHSYNQLYA